MYANANNLFCLILNNHCMFGLEELTKIKGDIKVLTAAFTLVARLWNSGEVLFESADVKFCLSLNPKPIFESADGAAVVASVMRGGWDDVTFIVEKVEIQLSMDNINCSKNMKFQMIKPYQYDQPQ